MNKYLARTIFDDVQNNIRRFCSCNSKHCRRMCIASCIACFLPASFVVQLTAFMIDNWTYQDTLYNNDSDYVACMSSDNPDARICGLGITVCSVELILTCTGFEVCVRSCSGQFDVQSCSFCYICFIPTLCLLHGILSLAVCIITAEDASDKQLLYRISFYAFLCIGCTTIMMSLAAICGYLCLKLGRVRQDYQHQIGSDDADTESTPVLQHSHS